ncbi:unnamed protein product [Paramecium pentaurelia]|uniref:Uncharacterized protein n=1 Tax=Paramecium pentaurelia TaxID=43138 RepID=A0A8S1X647_9CILI|nr:unnamed protein product [Paramecium pentaurelia]
MKFISISKLLRNHKEKKVRWKLLNKKIKAIIFDNCQIRQ